MSADLNELINEFAKLPGDQRNLFFEKLPLKHPLRGDFVRIDYEIRKAEHQLVAELGGDDELLSPRRAAELLVRRRGGQ